MVEVPAVTPVTTPEALMVAFPLELDHVPPEVAFDKLVVAPAQTVVVPVIVPALGRAFTVTVAIVVLLQPLAVTV